MDNNNDYWDCIAAEAHRAVTEGRSKEECPYPAGSREAWLWAEEFEVARLAPYFQAGSEAAQNGISRTACPSLPEDKRENWLLGWDYESGELQFAAFKNIEISGRTDMLIAG
jgi:ribosome modulation factor